MTHTQCFSGGSDLQSSNPHFHIVLYSNSFKKHIKYIRKVLERLRNARLKIKLRKCKFCKSKIKYLGYIVRRNDLRSDLAKIEKVKNILRLIKMKELRAVLRLFNYYKKFVKEYLKIVSPLYKLLKKEKEYIWIEK